MPRFAFLFLTLVLATSCGTAVDPTSDPDAASDPDASIPEPDASGSPPDAWTPPSCPGYASAVQPIYARHCASCHTTGRDPHFGSSLSVARAASSACGTSMAACTIQLGRPGGQMASADPYGGFSATDITTIQGWIGCGMPN